jgi:acetyltransferase-like isoleucine patch superfamily enzyme
LSPLQLIEAVAGAAVVEAGLPLSMLLRRAPQQPGKVLRVLWWLAKGFWYKWTYPLRGIRFQAGRNFRVQGRLHVRGPGKVVFGDNVVIGAYTTPWTHDRAAVITVGDGSYLNGTRMGAAKSITIGPHCILAEAHILDTDFHSVQINRHDPSAPVRTAPVFIAQNVWVAAHAGILPGARIGRNSVVGFGSVCTGEYPANCVIAGNPARVIRQIAGGKEKAVGS